MRRSEKKATELSTYLKEIVHPSNVELITLKVEELKNVAIAEGYALHAEGDCLTETELAATM